MTTLSVEQNRDSCEIESHYRAMPDVTREQLMALLRAPGLPNLTAIREKLAAYEAQIAEMERDREAVRVSVLAECAKLRAQIAEMGEQLEFDRSAVADCVAAANRAIDGRYWLTEGRGPYEWNDDNWHKEFFAAAVEIKGAIAPLTKIAANWKDCPQTGADVARARIDYKARIASLTTERDKAIRDLGEAEQRIAALSAASKCGFPLARDEQGEFIENAGNPSTPPRSEVDAANRDSAAWPSGLRDILEAFIEHAEPLAEYAGSQWADDNGISQPCHWLKETIKEARVFLGLPDHPGVCQGEGA